MSQPRWRHTPRPRIDMSPNVCITPSTHHTQCIQTILGPLQATIAPSLTTNYKPRYHESIHLLYTLNTFEFSNPWSLPYLLPTIPHWDCIRAVELRWSFPGHWLPSKDPVRAVYVSAGRAQWLETCRALSRLPALQSFVLTLENSWFCEPVEKLPVFLEPLRGLRVTRSRGVSRAGSLAALGQRFSEGSSSDAESSASSSGMSLSLRPQVSARACSCPLLSTAGSLTEISTKTVPVIQEDSGQATWELRLQGQSYYAHELWRVGQDLRRRGIDCCISTA